VLIYSGFKNVDQVVRYLFAAENFGIYLNINEVFNENFKKGILQPLVLNCFLKFGVQMYMKHPGLNVLKFTPQGKCLAEKPRG